MDFLQTMLMTSDDEMDELYHNEMNVVMDEINKKIQA